MRLTFSLFFFLLLTQVNAQTLINYPLLSIHEYERLGLSTAISSDGNIIAIGAPGNSELTDANGTVKVYENLNNNWVQKGQTIFGDSLDLVGTLVDLSADGKRLLAFSSRNNIPEINGFGKIDIFDYIDNTWTKIGQTILPKKNFSIGQQSSQICPNGNKVFYIEFNNSKDTIQLRILDLKDEMWKDIDTPLHTTNNTGPGLGEFATSFTGDTIALGFPGAQGTGKVCSWTLIDSTWKQLQNCVYGEGLIDRFGGKLDMSYDGKSIIVGGTNFDTSFDNDKSVHILHLKNGAWANKGNTISPNNIEDLFGFQVAISSDGNVVAISGTHNSEVFEKGGHVQIHKFIDNQWYQVGEDIYGQQENDECGYSLNLSSDGSVVAIGCPFYYTEEGQGQVLVYNLSIPLPLQEISINEIAAYPNPTSNVIYLDCDVDSEYKIFNTLGREVLTGKYTGEINTSKLTKGLYFVKVHRGDVIYSNQFIKI